MTTNGEWLFSKPFDEQMAWMHEEHQDGILDGDTAALNAKIAELTAERDKLQEQLLIGWECECRLQAERDTLQGALDIAVQNESRLTAERERYRSKFGKCLDYADAIHALMDDKGMA